MYSARELLPGQLWSRSTNRLAPWHCLIVYFGYEAAGMRSDGLSPCRSSPKPAAQPPRAYRVGLDGRTTSSQWQAMEFATGRCVPEGPRPGGGVAIAVVATAESPSSAPQTRCFTRTSRCRSPHRLRWPPPFGRWRQPRVNPRRPARYKIVKKRHRSTLADVDLCRGAPPPIPAT